jgi:hypothetical protein
MFGLGKKKEELSREKLEAAVSGGVGELKKKFMDGTITASEREAMDKIEAILKKDAESRGKK